MLVLVPQFLLQVRYKLSGSPHRAYHVKY
jgi:hypothetical protein